MNHYKYIYNLLFLVSIILLPAIKSIYLDIDAAGRTEILLTIIAIIVNGKELLKIPKPMWFWIIWDLYSIINIYFKGFDLPNYPLQLWIPLHIFAPSVAMIIAYLSVKENYHKTITILFYSMIIYVAMGGFSMSMGEFINEGVRYGNSMGNSFLNCSVLLLTYSSLYFSETRKSSFLPLSFIIIILGYIILLSGERKAAIALFIIIIGLYLSRSKTIGFAMVLRLTIIAVLVYYGVGFVMENTVAGARMVNQMEESEYENNLFYKLMGDRAIMYEVGWKLFQTNFFTGIGLTNSSWSEAQHIFHTEYMVQLSECGIIGFALFLCFYIGMISREFKLIKCSIYNKEVLITATTLLAIMLINFVSWTYDEIPYFLFFGLLYARAEVCLNNLSAQNEFLDDIILTNN